MRLSEKFSNTVALSKDMFSVPALLLILGSKRLESLYPQREENPLIFLRGYPFRFFETLSLILGMGQKTVVKNSEIAIFLKFQTDLFANALQE